MGTEKMTGESVEVPLGDRSYTVEIGLGFLGELGARVRSAGLKQTQAFVVTNPQVGGLYFERLRVALESAGFSRVVRHDLPETEAGKNWEEFTATCAALLEAFPDTGSVPLVVLLGGGVVGDLGGFAAGVFRRGVPFVQVPTTLLAAVDSSVGGKVAVNMGGVKNIFGIFNQPRLVVCDLSALDTLSDREMRSGMAEVIKYGGVCSGSLFEQLEAPEGVERVLRREPAALLDVVAQCVRLKAGVVAQDELDRKGIRNVLNFGHTIGHAIELSAEYALTHGEAISVGMMAATRLAIEVGVCGESFLSRLRGLLERAGLPTRYPEGAGLFERVIRAMQMDKKFREGRNVFVLPTGAGGWVQRENVSWDLVHAVVREALSE
jgi:3-dehydroquinate synthase